MKVTKCENRFEVVVQEFNIGDAKRLIEEFQDWVLDKEFKGFESQMPTDEDYLAALGPCGK
jgi:hypothetical protein